MDYLRLLRPKQWIKNLFVFAVLIFARDLFQLPLLGLTAAAFVLFCLSSSGVYIINDILDVEHDRIHPVKRHRPIASGRVPVDTAAGLSLALLAAGLIGSFLVTRPLGFVTFAYILLMVGLRPRESISHPGCCSARSFSPCSSPWGNAAMSCTC